MPVLQKSTRWEQDGEHAARNLYACAWGSESGTQWQTCRQNSQACMAQQALDCTRAAGWWPGPEPHLRTETVRALGTNSGGSLLSLLSTRLTSRTVPPVVATTHPPEWTGDPEAHTNRVLPSESKWWTCKACGDRAVCATQCPLF